MCSNTSFSPIERALIWIVASSSEIKYSGVVERLIPCNTYPDNSSILFQILFIEVVIVAWLIPI